MAAATAIAAVVLLLLGALCSRSKFARSWFLTLYYCGVILVRGLSMPNDAEYRKMVRPRPSVPLRRRAKPVRGTRVPAAAALLAERAASRVCG